MIHLLPLFLKLISIESGRHVVSQTTDIYIYGLTSPIELGQMLRFLPPNFLGVEKSNKKFAFKS